MGKQHLDYIDQLMEEASAVCEIMEAMRNGTVDRAAVASFFSTI